MTKRNTGRRGRQANVVGATSMVGFGGVSTPTGTTSSVSPVERAGNATVNPLLSSGGSSRDDIGIVVKQTGGSSSGVSTPTTPSTPSTPSTPVKTTTPTTTTPVKVGVTTGPVVTPAVTTPTTTPTTTTPTQTKVIVDPKSNTIVTPTTPPASTAPPKVGITDGPAVDNTEKEKEEDMDTKPGFNGLEEPEEPIKKIEDLVKAKIPEDGMFSPVGTTLPAIPQPKTSEETAPEPAKTDKNKKLLIVIVAGIVLWLLFKKRK